MIERIGGPNYQSFAGKINPAGSETDFRAQLDKVFKDVTSQLQKIPGMPGVYSINPQTLASLNIADISDKAA